MDISKITSKLFNLRQRKLELQKEYDKKLSQLNKQIKEEEIILEKINQILSPYICKCCGGNGEESFTDAAGGRDWRTCKSCNGSGINIKEQT